MNKLKISVGYKKRFLLHCILVVVVFLFFSLSVNFYAFRFTSMCVVCYLFTVVALRTHRATSVSFGLFYFYYSLLFGCALCPCTASTFLHVHYSRHKSESLLVWRCAAHTKRALSWNSFILSKWQGVKNLMKTIMQPFFFFSLPKMWIQNTWRRNCMVISDAVPFKFKFNALIRRTMRKW